MGPVAMLSQGCDRLKEMQNIEGEEQAQSPSTVHSEGEHQQKGQQQDTQSPENNEQATQ